MSQTAQSPRQPHVMRDPDVRARKAHKVGRILQRLALSPSGEWALDVGCGAGFIADHLRELGWRTVAIDLKDHRVTSGFDFLFGQAEALPFPDSTFSLVVSNHVIEHVLDPVAHLREIRRMLAPGGIAYLATPNRLAVLEPHYKLPFLSWLPAHLADAYVRLLRRGQDYDVSPPIRGRLLREAAAVGLRCEDITAWMIEETATVEGSRLAQFVGQVLPDRVLRWLSFLSPTLVFVMHRGEFNSQAK